VNFFYRAFYITHREREGERGREREREGERGREREREQRLFYLLSGYDNMIDSAFKKKKDNKYKFYK
jgi:hypothetical protein